MILKIILQILRQIFSLQKENTDTLIQICNSLKPIPADETWLHTEDVMRLFKKTEKPFITGEEKASFGIKLLEERSII